MVLIFVSVFMPGSSYQILSVSMDNISFSYQYSWLVIIQYPISIYDWYFHSYLISFNVWYFILVIGSSNPILSVLMTGTSFLYQYQYCDWYFLSYTFSAHDKVLHFITVLINGNSIPLLSVFMTGISFLYQY